MPLKIFIIFCFNYSSVKFFKEFIWIFFLSLNFGLLTIFYLSLAIIESIFISPLFYSTPGSFPSKVSEILESMSIKYFSVCSILSFIYGFKIEFFSNVLNSLRLRIIFEISSILSILLELSSISFWSFNLCLKQHWEMQ